MKANSVFLRLISVAMLGSSLGVAAQQTPATPAASPDPGLDTVAELTITRALFLRCLCVGDTLSFDLSGHPEGKSQPVDWTLDAVDVAKVKRTGPERVELEAVRAAMRWNDYNKNFDRHPMKPETLRIVLNGVTDATSARRAVATVFSQGIDQGLQASMPSYWRHYFDPSLPWADGVPSTPIVRAGDKVGGVEVPTPSVAKKPMVDYTMEASRDHVEGPVTLQLLVDASGAKHRVHIVTPLGYGLDARAVEAAEKTQFLPVVVGGQPAAVVFYLRENFAIAPPQSPQ